MTQKMSKRMYDFFVSAFGCTPEEVDQLKKDYSELKKEYAERAKEIQERAKRIQENNEEIRRLSKEIIEVIDKNCAKIKERSKLNKALPNDTKLYSELIEEKRRLETRLKELKES